jgi:hypothetical protein
MTRVALLCLLAACGCAVDDRSVELNAACIEPAADGTIADFFEAHARACPAGFCSGELANAVDAVTLGEGKFAGLVFPYISSGLEPVHVGTTYPNTTDDPSQNALWAVLASGAVPGGATVPSAPDGFALEFVYCIDAEPYSALSFEVTVDDDSIGTCPLKVAANFKEPGSAMLGEAQPLTGVSDSETVVVAPGTVTLPLGPSKQRTGHSALGGLQWEFNVPGADPAGCDAYLTIDDIRLVR